MSTKLIKDRLLSYKPSNKLEELNAIKEIIQEISLYAMNRRGFFKKAAFQGGTCLRIVHGLPRFSEDLDFIAIERGDEFEWQSYIEEIQYEFSQYDLNLNVKDRSKASDSVKKDFLKEDSFGKVLQLKYDRNRSDPQVLLIKLEIDTNPPIGSGFENQIVDFPIPFSVVTQDMPSLFAGKLHAILCRKYVKGRDWFDFIWYVSRTTEINLLFLQHALYQYGPWAKQELVIDKIWIKDQLQEKIDSLEWQDVVQDVINFIRPKDQHALDNWGKDFFTKYVERL